MSTTSTQSTPPPGENAAPARVPPPGAAAAPAGPDKDRLFAFAAFALLALAWSVFLAYHRIADGDLWARLAVGAFFWNHGSVSAVDPFAFTPILPRWVDHEWGAGAVYFGLIRLGGGEALMLFKLAAAMGAMAFAMAAGRRAGTPWGILALIAPLCAFAVTPGYVAVVRSHALTYVFFGFTLWQLETCRAALVQANPQPHQLPPEDECRRYFRIVNWRRVAWIGGVMLIWANCHGGFVTGYAPLGVYFGCFVLANGKWPASQFRVLGGALLAALLVTAVNPYGFFGYWEYLLPALLHPRPWIEEWRPMPLWRMDSFLGFRILFALALVLIPAGWRRSRANRSWEGLALLALTAAAAWSSRRHAPFFGLACAAYLGPYLAGAGESLRRLGIPLPRAAHAAVALAALAAIHGGLRHLPEASTRPLAPVGFYPVREADILDRAGVSGNLAVPFRWGSYAMWRLHPKIKVSIDGRYEETYPESTFLMNMEFFNKKGPDWDRLLRLHRVDYIMLDLRNERLRPEDLFDRGYGIAWYDEGYSALMASKKTLEPLRAAARSLPPSTIDPFDPAIAKDWPESPERPAPARP